MFRSPCSSLFAKSLLLILSAAIMLPSFPVPATRAFTPNNAGGAASPAEARAALEQGRASLRRNQADLAFTQLETALNLFTSAGDRSGAAAAEDLIGDIYTRSGQYDVALTHYTTALTTFRAVNDTANADALRAKIGETHFLRGDTAAALRAFGEIQATPPAPGKPDDKKNDPAALVPTGGAMAGAASFASCFAPGVANLASNAGTNSEPPNMGRAPRTPNGIGRMDLRVTDEAGEPLKGVRAQLKSQRSDGFKCDCWNTTDILGRAVMPPLHIGKIKLLLKVPGMADQELALAAEALDQPVRVVVNKTGAQLASAAASAAAAAVVNPCFDFYRAFIARSNATLGAARAEQKDDKDTEARARYEALLASLALPGAENIGQVPRFRASARTALGDIAFKEGRYTDALKLYTEARDAARADNRLDLMWAAERGLGRTLWRQAEAAKDSPEERARLRAEALPHYREALKVIETIRDGSLRADDARTLFLATTKDVYDETSAALIEMAFAAASSAAGTKASSESSAPVELKGYALSLAAEAFKVGEQGRARALLDMLGEARGDITEGVPADLLKRRTELLARQGEITQLLTGVTLGDEKPRVSVQQLEEELDRIGIAYDGLENQIRTSSPRYGALTGAQPRTLADIQQQILGADTALLVYQLGANKSYAWAITRDTVHIATLPSREPIEEMAMALRAQLIPIGLRRSIVGIDVTQRGVETPRDATSSQAPDVNSYAAAANNLYRTILQPSASIFAGKRLLVVADGALNYVPFEALVTEPAAANADYGALAYLVKTNEIAYAPSASVVAAIRAQTEQVRRAAGNPAQGSLLLVADPVFDQQDARVQASASASKSATARTRGIILPSALKDVAGASPNLGLTRLIGSRDEANAIAQLARAGGGTADVWLDLDASEANVTSRDMRNYRVLHFATHGLLNAERPKFTGIVLSLVGEGRGDGFLRANEIFNFKIGAPLVMLSACESGLGKERRGEGVVGLTRAFMYAGAPTVGVSLWSVSDRSTARLMSDFYKEYLTQAGATPGVALRRAQLNMIANNRYNAPFFWAPFVLVGDWR